MFALGGKELGPGHYFGMLFEEGAALAFGHAAPDAEFDAVIQRVGATFEDHGTVATDHGGFALGGASDENSSGSACLHRAWDTQAMRASASAPWTKL